MESPYTPGRSCRPRGPSGWASPGTELFQPHPVSHPPQKQGPSPWLRVLSSRLGRAVHENPQASSLSGGARRLQTLPPQGLRQHPSIPHGTLGSVCSFGTQGGPIWELRASGVPSPRCHKSRSTGKGWCLLAIQSDLPSPSLTLSQRSRPQKKDTAKTLPPCPHLLSWTSRVKTRRKGFPSPKCCLTLKLYLTGASVGPSVSPSLFSPP